MYLSASFVRIGESLRCKRPHFMGVRYTKILFLRMAEVHEEITSQTPALCFRVRRHKRACCRVQHQIRDRARYRAGV